VSETIPKNFGLLQH